MPFLLKLVLKKCCYPELGAGVRTGAGQDWTGSTTLITSINSIFHSQAGKWYHEVSPFLMARQMVSLLWSRYTPSVPSEISTHFAASSLSINLTKPVPLK